MAAIRHLSRAPIVEVDCFRADWDGYKALPVNPESYQNAKRAAGLQHLDRLYRLPA